MTEATLIYPHQLWNTIGDFLPTVYLVEDPLFFCQYRFHTQKLLLHRASMKRFEARLIEAGKFVRYIEHTMLKESASIGEILRKDKISVVQFYELDDEWLYKRLSKGLVRNQIQFSEKTSPGFLTPLELSVKFFSEQRRNFFTDYYIWQRKRLHLLLDKGKPVGGKWSFDHDNRKKMPKDISPPPLPGVIQDSYVIEATDYIKKYFPDAYGNANQLLYPHTHESAERWLDNFIDNRLSTFGDYEDAMSETHPILFHSVLTPMLNIGLLRPEQIISSVLRRKNVPLNSLEGFVRQMIGWREYMRAMYMIQGTKMRNGNFFDYHREIPRAFYDGTTGILPVDTVIRRVLNSGYCHHIERLMILGNFLLLCGIKPNSVYQWFMELFVDAYDWVMVPNVYAMSQFAEGGTMTTKPYVSGSSYVLKMSDYKRGSWCEIWDALYWNHIASHRGFYASNPRMGVMASMCDKLGDKIVVHQQRAKSFIDSLFIDA